MMWGIRSRAQLLVKRFVESNAHIVLAQKTAAQQSSSRTDVFCVCIVAGL